MGFALFCNIRFFVDFLLIFSKNQLKRTLI